MPSTSKKQHNFMEAVAHSPSFAKKVGVPQNVGQEFSKADKGRTFKQGGNMKNEMHHHHMKMAHHHLKEAMKHGGEAKEPHSKDMGEKAFKHGGHVRKMAGGGDTVGREGIAEKRGMTTAKMGRVAAGGEKKHGEHKIQERGHTRALQEKMKGNTIGDGPLYNVKGPAMKRGGKTHAMKRGGKAC